jgi:hypothetical protein
MSTEHEPRDSEGEPTADELRAEIEQTREELGDTVEALAAKTDVKARTRARADDIKSSALARKDELTAKVKEKLPGSNGGGQQTVGDAPASSSAAPSASPSAQEQAQEYAEKAVATVKARPLPFAIAGSLLLGYLVGRAVSG